MASISTNHVRENYYDMTNYITVNSAEFNCDINIMLNKSNTKITVLRGHNAPMMEHNHGFSADKKHLVTRSYDGVIKVWKMDDILQYRDLTKNEQKECRVVMKNDNPYLKNCQDLFIYAVKDCNSRMGYVLRKSIECKPIVEFKGVGDINAYITVGNDRTITVRENGTGLFVEEWNLPCYKDEMKEFLMGDVSKTSSVYESYKSSNLYDRNLTDLVLGFLKL